MLSFVLIGNAQDTIPVSIERTIRYVLAKRDSLILVDFDSIQSNFINSHNFRGGITIKRLFELTHHVRELSSPFTLSTFHLFVSTGIEPASYAVFCVKDTQFYEVPKDSLVRSFQSRAFVGFINSRLHSEPIFKEDQVLELAHFIVMLTDPGYEFNKLLRSSGDIVLKESEQLPKSIIRTIHPPKISYLDQSIIVNFYIWDMSSTKLRRIEMIYEEGKISFNVYELGSYGESHLLL